MSERKTYAERKEEAERDGTEARRRSKQIFSRILYAFTAIAILGVIIAYFLTR